MSIRLFRTALATLVIRGVLSPIAPGMSWAAQNSTRRPSSPPATVLTANFLGQSAPLRAIIPAPPKSPSGLIEHPLPGPRPTPSALIGQAALSAASLGRVDQAGSGSSVSTATAAVTPPSAPMPTPNLSFEGASDAEHAALLGWPVLPPDPDGAAGPNDYVQVVNDLIEIFDKSTGALVLSQPLSALFNSAGQSVCGEGTADEPSLRYDSLAGRWLLAESAQSISPAAYYECVAVSTAEDPAGSYYLYVLEIPGGYLNDYSKFAVWPDGYYMSANLFSGKSFVGAGVFAWERGAMLSGGAGPTVIYFDLGATRPGASLFAMLPSDFDGPPPPAGEANHFIALAAPQFGDPRDALRIFDFHADFATARNSTFTERPESPIVTAAFNPTVCASGDCVPQPNTSQALEVLSGRLMPRLQYRNFGTYETLVVSHTVRANTRGAAAAVRYYELRNSSTDRPFAIHDQATFAPDANSRWMESAALDHQGNLAVGYSLGAAGLYPSVAYAGRAYNVTGGLTAGEVVLEHGGGSQSDVTDRWGDYSSLAVDPSDDCTFWYTNEYYAATGDHQWHTRIGSFKFPTCSAPAP